MGAAVAARGNPRRLFWIATLAGLGLAGFLVCLLVLRLSSSGSPGSAADGWLLPGIAGRKNGRTSPEDPADSDPDARLFQLWQRMITGGDDDAEVDCAGIRSFSRVSRGESSSPAAASAAATMAGFPGRSLLQAEAEEAAVASSGAQAHGDATPQPPSVNRGMWGPARRPASNSLVQPIPLIAGCGRSGTLSMMSFLNQLGVPAVHEATVEGRMTVSWIHTPRFLGGTEGWPIWDPTSKFRLAREAELAAMGLPLFGPVVQVVRHPLKVISSTRRCFCGTGTRAQGGLYYHTLSWDFVDRHLTLPKAAADHDSLLRAMIYWFQWNVNVPLWHAGQVVRQLRLEDLDPEDLVDALALTRTPEIERRLAEIRARAQQTASASPESGFVPNDPQHASGAESREQFPDVTWRDVHAEDPAWARRIFRLAQSYGYEPGRTLDEYL